MKSPGSSPDNAIVTGVSAASPIFERVIFIPELVVFKFWLPNETDSGLKLTLGAGFTVCASAAEVLVTKLPSPPYTAVMLSVLVSGRLEMLNVPWSGHGGVPHEATLSVPVPIDDP